MGRRAARIAVIVAVVLGASSFVPAGAGAAASTWKVQKTGLAVGAVLNDVACAGKSLCFAVGFKGTPPKTSSVIARWDGKHWSKVASPRLGHDSLSGLSCASPTFCVAVGGYASNHNANTLVEMWNGTRWAVEPSPNPSIFGNYLVGVSCVKSTTRCTAAGEFTDMHSYAYPFAKQWDGFRWDLDYLPNQGILDSRVAEAISCASGTRCVAVGDLEKLDDHGAVADLAYIVKWNAKDWVDQAGDEPDSQARTLQGVTCTTVTPCIAVGQEADHAFVETSAGSTWTIEPSADTGPGYSHLDGVTCPLTSRCLAVGAASPGRLSEQALIESRHGSTWSLVAAPTFANGSRLTGVACATTTVCFAVGNALTSSQALPLILRGSL